MDAVEIMLTVKTRMWREGKTWIADCPALGVVVQMDTEAAARKEFGVVVKSVLEISKEQGTFAQLMQHAASHPETLWQPVQHRTKMVEVGVPVPVSYLAGQYAQQKAA